MISLNKTGNLEYVSSGLFKSEGVWCHPRRIIDSYEIIFMHDGVAYICEDGIEYTLVKNDILLLEPGKEHFGFRQSEEYVSFAWLHYRTDCDKYKSFAKHIGISNSGAIKTLFSQCLHISNTPLYDSVCTDLYTALYIEELLYGIKTSSEPQNHLAARVKEYIRLNIEKDLSVAQTAAYFGYHENYLSKIFKNTYGVQLKKYISKQKTEYACTLLNTTVYTINRISQILSFRSENHFIKFFKYHMGLTPSEYRNVYTNTHINKS